MISHAKGLRYIIASVIALTSFQAVDVQAGETKNATVIFETFQDEFPFVNIGVHNAEQIVALKIEGSSLSILNDHLISLLRSGAVLYTMSKPELLRKQAGISGQFEASTGVTDIGYALRLTGSGMLSDIHISDWREITFGAWGKFEDGEFVEDSMSSTSIKQAVYGGSELQTDMKERLVTSAIERWVHEVNVNADILIPGNSWVLMGSSTFDGSNADRVYVNTFDMYKLADNNASADFYMITTKTNTKVKNPTAGNDGEGWQTSDTRMTLDGNEFENSGRSVKLFEYGPTTTVPITTVSFTVGASISTSAIGESFSYSETWRSDCVTTTDKSNVTIDRAEWRIDFADPGGFACLKQNCTPAKNTFFTKPTAIFRLTSGAACPTSRIKIGVHPLGNFKNWVNGFLCLTRSWTSLATHWPTGWISWGTNLKPFVTSHTPEQSPVTVPVGNFLDFRVSGSDSDGCAISYIWTLDGQTVGSSSTYRYTPQCDNPSSQSIRATVTDPRGGSDFYQWTVFVDKSTGRPGTPIISGPSEVCGGVGAQFTASASGDPTSWNWSSGCGGSFNPPNGSSTTWTPPLGFTGFCQINVAATNSCGSSNKGSKTVNVRQKPGTPIVSGPSEVCGGVGAQFTASASGDPTSWNWSSGCGGSFNPPNGSSTTWTPPSGFKGSCTITAQASNNCGASTGDKTLDVGQAPIPPIIVGPDTVCCGEPVELILSSLVEIPSCTWVSSCGGNIEIVSPTTVKWTPPCNFIGECTINITCLDRCGTVSLSIKITVISNPNSIDQGSSGCFPDTLAGHILFWNDVESAEIYYVYQDGVSIDSTLDTTYKAGSDAISHEYAIRAGNSCGLSDSTYVICLITDVEDDKGDDLLPRVFRLHQNYPNPFNPSTQIAFALPRKSFVTLEIFNVQGRRIATLMKRELSAGYNTVTWDGKNDSGAQVSSGIYFYRLVAGEFVQSRKMVLLK